MSLLFDALDRVLTDPRSAPRWHSLTAALNATRDPATRQSILERIKAASENDPQAEILRLSFLAGATGERQFEIAAARRTLQLVPPDPDRLAAAMSFQWLSALQYSQGREDFAAALAAGQVPDMAMLLAREAEAALPNDMVSRTSDEIERVALVTPYIGHQFHTPSLMAISQAELLAREGRKVHIFSAQELIPPDSSMYRGDARDLVLAPLDVAAWRERLPAGVALTLADNRFGMRGRWRNLLAAVAGFDPDAVMLVGLYSALASALYARRPVVGLSVNSVAPVAPVDVWLAGEPQPARRMAWGPPIPAPHATYHSYRIARSRHKFQVSRASLGLPESAVVLVTAGFRLEHEIKPDWADRMQDILSNNANAILLLVGGSGRIPAALSRIPPNRIRALATRDDVPGILRCCDIYLNPPRMGGGFSVLEAMAEGVPVITLSGSDGGDKLGEAALPDMDAYMKRLTELLESAELRRVAGAELRKRFDEVFDIDASGPALLRAFGTAADLARIRLKATA